MLDMPAAGWQFLERTAAAVSDAAAWLLVVD
jgi:hypothetical protein